MSLIQRLSNREFEFGLSPAQLVYYWLEREACHRLMRRPPPDLAGPRLLNLGCGPHIYEGWVNADDYAFKRRLRESAFRPNWRLDITRPWRCRDGFFDGLFSEHVIEHVSYSEAVHVFREAFRTLKPGSWIRISVPDLAKYVRFYQGEPQAPGFEDFPERALGVSFLTQMHMHRSAWDAALMTRVLAEIGFTDTSEVAFGEGSDPRLIRDDPDKVHESLYVEARRP
jgi:predicted SAM-dependent methyltransferase